MKVDSIKEDSNSTVKRDQNIDNLCSIKEFVSSKIFNDFSIRNSSLKWLKIPFIVFKSSIEVALLCYIATNLAHFIINCIYVKNQASDSIVVLKLLATEKVTGKIMISVEQILLKLIKKMEISKLEEFHSTTFFKFRSCIPLLLWNIFSLKR